MPRSAEPRRPGLYGPWVLIVLASCTIGSAQCDDVGTGAAVPVPWWIWVLIAIGTIALIAGFIGLLQRANRNRPWD